MTVQQNGNGLVNIIVPVYNVEKYLDKCLESITAQTYKEIAVILVEDGSSDNSWEICDKWAKYDNRVQAIHMQHRGVSAARNVALKMCTGEYIAFVDADDYIETFMIEKLVQTMNESKKIDAVFGGYNEIDDKSGKVLRKIIPNEHGIVDRDTGVAQIFGDYSPMLWNKLFRRKIIMVESLFDEELCIGEDELWMIQILERADNIALLNIPIYNYRNRQESASKDFSLSPARLTELDSQKKVLKNIYDYGSEELVVLAQKRMYYSGQKIMKIAFYEGQHELSRRIYHELEEVRKVWFALHRNLLGKWRRRLVETMIYINVSPKIVKIFDK